MASKSAFPKFADPGSAFDSFDNAAFDDSVVSQEFDDFGTHDDGDAFSPATPASKASAAAATSKRRNAAYADENDDDDVAPPSGPPPDDDDYAVEDAEEEEPPPPPPPPPPPSKLVKAPVLPEDAFDEPPPRPARKSREAVVAAAVPPPRPSRSSRDVKAAQPPPPPPPATARYDDDEDEEDEEDMPPPPPPPPQQMKKAQAAAGTKAPPPPRVVHDEYDDDDDYEDEPPPPPAKGRVSAQAPPPPPPPHHNHGDDGDDGDDDDDRRFMRESTGSMADTMSDDEPQPPPPPRSQMPPPPPRVNEKDNSRWDEGDTLDESQATTITRPAFSDTSATSLDTAPSPALVQSAAATPPPVPQGMTNADRKAEFLRKKREQEAADAAAAATAAATAATAASATVASAPAGDSAAERKAEYLRKKREAEAAASAPAADGSAPTLTPSDVAIPVPPDHPPPPVPAVNRPPSHPPPLTDTHHPSELAHLVQRFVAAAHSGTRTVHGVVLADIKDAFRAADDDGDGSASLLQLQAMFKLVDSDLSTEQARRLVWTLAGEQQRSWRSFSLGEFVDAVQRVVPAERPHTYAAKVEMALPSRGLDGYARWIDSLRVWTHRVDDLCAELKSGVLLCRVVEHLMQAANPRFSLRGINVKARSKTPSLQNIELALGVLWKQRVSARNMPSAERIYNGDAPAVLNLMRELFTALALPPGSRVDVLEWFNDVLRHYNMHLSDAVLAPPHRGLFSAFKSCDALACVLHFFCGPEGAADLPAVDLSRIYWSPESEAEALVNAKEVVGLLELALISCPLSAEALVEGEDADMLMVLLCNLHREFKTAPCALPLAMPGGVPPAAIFVHVDADGQARVSGVEFKDRAAGAAASLHGIGAQAPPPPPPPVQQQEQQQQRATKRRFQGEHVFASSDDPVAQGWVPPARTDSYTVLPLMSSASSSAAALPSVLSQELRQSSRVSLQRTLRLSEPSVPAVTMPSRAMTLDDIKTRLRERASHYAHQAQPPVDYEERRLLDLEEARRRAFLQMTVESAARRERVATALKWLGARRVVLIHNRNSVDRCYLSARAVQPSRDYVLEWVNARDAADTGSLLVSDLDDVEVDRGPPFVVYLHLAAARPQAVRRSKGRSSLKLEPERADEGLRLFTHVACLKDDGLMLQPADGGGGGGVVGGEEF